MDQQRKRPGRTTIVHISDLHFDPDTDYANDPRWSALVQDASSEDVDVLVVTGDLIDNARAMASRKRTRASFANVKRYLQSFAQELRLDFDTQVFVVPGNHDFRATGIGWFSSAAYDEFHEAFGQNYRDAFMPLLKVAILSFDSNGTKFFDLASGTVSEQALIEAGNTCARWKADDRAAWNEATIIALLHHHPLPIAATDHRESITELNEFLLLKNAGLFMTQMVNCGVDIVLHGHKHYPAFARIRFPVDDNERVLTVVAAGSVGQSARHPLAYNRVILNDHDESVVRRRQRTAAAYTEDRSFTIVGYEEMRRERFRRLAANGALTRARKYMRFQTIEDLTGTIVTAERFEEVTSYSDRPVKSMPMQLEGRTAYFPEPSYEADDPQQRITWEWAGAASDKGVREGVTEFDPPIGQTPISYRRTRTHPNAIHFNARERRYVGAAAGEESMWVSVRNAIELLVLSIAFPPARFPKQLQVVVLGPDGEPDVREQNYASRYFAYLEHAATAVLTIDHPLPTYRYSIRWSLPEDEAAELGLNAQDAALATAVERATLALRADPVKRGEVAAALAAFARSVDASKDLYAVLFSFDDAKGQLVIAATSDPKLFDDAAAAYSVPSGRTIVGQAYRRRTAVMVVNARGVRCDDHVYDEPMPFETNPHVALLAVPVVYPADCGRRVGVIALGTDDLGSALMGLYRDAAKMDAAAAATRAAFVNDVVPLLGV